MNEQDLAVRLHKYKEHLPYCFANYKEMCKALGLPYQSNTKKREQQLFGQGENSLVRYADVKKVKGTNQYRITEIYDIPLPYEDKRSPYKQNLEMVLLYMFKQLPCKDGMVECYLSESDIIDSSFMVNEKYEYSKSSEKLFYWITLNSFFTQKLQTVLNSLVKKRYIKCTPTIVYTTTRDGAYSVATNKQETTYNEIYNDTIREFSITHKKEIAHFGESPTHPIYKYETQKCTTAYQLIYIGKYGDFYERLCKNVKSKLGWVNWKEKYEITTSPKLIKYAIDDVEAARRGYELNDKVQNGLKQLKALDKEYTRWEDGEIIKKRIPPDMKEPLIKKYIAISPAENEAEIAKALAQKLVKKAMTI